MPRYTWMTITRPEWHRPEADLLSREAAIENFNARKAAQHAQVTQAEDSTGESLANLTSSLVPSGDAANNPAGPWQPRMESRELRTACRQGPVAAEEEGVPGESLSGPPL